MRHQALRGVFRRAGFEEEYSLRFVDSVHRRRQFHFASSNRRREVESSLAPMLAGLGIMFRRDDGTRNGATTY
jgi:hypothetical protein